MVTVWWTGDRIVDVFLESVIAFNLNYKLSTWTARNLSHKANDKNSQKRDEVFKLNGGGAKFALQIPRKAIQEKLDKKLESDSTAIRFRKTNYKLNLVDDQVSVGISVVLSQYLYKVSISI